MAMYTNIIVHTLKPKQHLLLQSVRTMLDGFRGHVFLSPDNGTVVLAIKGTTLQGPTSKKDKFNDNLLFSCCCARVDLTWVFRQVCDCYAKKWRCDSACLTDALVQDSLFYTVGVVST